MKPQITNTTDAREAISAVCEYLETLSKQSVRHDHEMLTETDTESLARSMCHDLLDAADANGNGGCLLCRS